ncbi:MULTISPECIES: 2Fe-2S iron-sulfur cluster-binding protein [Hymenobacter]|jgi:NADH-quinone oxidoreductase subunit G|uniref:2Fe-2S iron-sulfur cluster binding domain-containing protein n=1 Tax=Hymenobacter setariae TaxID=2594794 RepID=A0A558BN15_9BACT|nr:MULTISPECIES: 2Fe-2S iron-sulfur cluster-binding protein [Hymenobacter]MBJ6143832.1 (2Fe-2S)-binding protein [Hymenobacter sp. BT559]TVT37897.1 2Fe-2S iron-sulfur cluster binding domain-containing protein [Hymenobacter setariae]
MAKITFDGIEVEVPDGTTILNAARKIGGGVVPPAMCYYTPLKGSGGKCRACLVRVAAGSTKDPRPMPKLVASCITPVQDGMVVENTTSQQVLDVRKGIVEMLLINHPLDCPVCDQAGECDLQNFAYEHGVSTTRYEEERRTFEKIDIGPYVQLHMTRCILCYRCVYTADQLTEGRVHGVLGRGDAAEIGTYIENSIDKDFSGNVIDVCPVGALTDKTFRFKQRVWFTKPVNAHRDCGHEKCAGRVTLWYKGKDVLRVTARKDEYGEVKEWICNECRFEKKETSDWVIEGPAHIDRSSVISANHYELPVINPQVIADLPESTVRELEKNPPLKLGGPNGTSF